MPHKHNPPCKGVALNIFSDVILTGKKAFSTSVKLVHKNRHAPPSTSLEKGTCFKDLFEFTSQSRDIQRNLLCHQTQVR